jgi:predicted Zn-dependent protease
MSLRRKAPLAALVALVACLAQPLASAQASPSPNDGALKKALEDELARSTEKLHLGKEGPPYYLAYTVVDDDHATVNARLGGIVTEERNPWRRLRVELRVGSYDDDNTNFRGASEAIGTAGTTRDDDVTSLRHDLWELTDREYKKALESFARKKASKTVESEGKDRTPDFAKIAPVQSVNDKVAAPTDADRAKLRDAATKLSAVFRDFPTVNDGRVDGSVSLVRRRMLTSEKSWTDERWSRARIDVRAETTTPEGQRLSASTTFTAADMASLPSLEKMQTEVRALAQNLADQRTAPSVDPGSASVVFEGQASAQLARMLLASELSGQPEPKSADARPRDGSMSFAEKIGLSVAPKWITVTDDPRALGANKKPLAGSYETDDEGVPGEKLTLIDHGVVKTLFMSRVPRKEIPRSNGHGRGAGATRAGASNLVMHADGGLPRPALLAAAARSAGPKGTVYIVRQLDGSSGLGRGQTLVATVAFRLDGAKETPIRGLSLEGIVPKRMKKDLVAAGTDTFVLEEDGFTPTSFTAPSLLFEDVDVGKPNDKSRIPPLYPSPLQSK